MYYTHSIFVTAFVIVRVCTRLGCPHSCGKCGCILPFLVLSPLKAHGRILFRPTGTPCDCYGIVLSGDLDVDVE